MRESAYAIGTDVIYEGSILLSEDPYGMDVNPVPPGTAGKVLSRESFGSQLVDFGENGGIQDILVEEMSPVPLPEPLDHFVFYGTLRDIYENDVVTRIGDCFVEGFDLYDYHRKFPAAVRGTGVVHCVMYRIEREYVVDALDTFDHIEGYVEHAEERSLYVRRRVEVCVGDDRVVAWMYLWNLPCAGLPRVEDGRWAR